MFTIYADDMPVYVHKWRAMKIIVKELKKYKLFYLNWCQWPVPQFTTGRSTVQRNNKEKIKKKSIVWIQCFDATITSSAKDDLSVTIKALRHKANNFMGEKWFSLMGKHQHLNNSFYPFPSFVCCWRLTILCLSLHLFCLFFLFLTFLFLTYQLWLRVPPGQKAERSSQPISRTPAQQRLSSDLLKLSDLIVSIVVKIAPTEARTLWRLKSSVTKTRPSLYKLKKYQD